jgi:hypothetical protein
LVGRRGKWLPEIPLEGGFAAAVGAEVMISRK